MRKVIIVILVLLIALVAVVPVFAEAPVGPCTDSDGPGNSGYGRHHISFLAKLGALGNGGHKPGTHQGFSACLGVH